jgi:glycosyltransferase involved in cell wall biosynthesis
MPSFGPGYGLLRSRAYLSAERYCGRFTTGYACVGENVRQRYIASGVAPGDRFFIVRTPIELAPFLSTRDARPEDKARYRAQLGLPLGPALAVSIGALEPRKRHALLLRCLAPLLRSGALHLAIAGIGPEERRLRDTADELGVGDHVQFAGYLTQPDRLLAAADVVVHASRAEGVCRVFVEAAASGTPVVSTDVEGALEVPGVTVVSRDGTGLGAAVQRVLGRTCAVDVSELLPWTSSAVEQQFDSFQKRVAVHE